MVVGWGGVKVTGPTEGRVMAGMGTGPLAKGWPAGGATAGNGWPGGGTRTDLETSSNHRSASDGVRLWEGMRTGEEVRGGTKITGVGADQLLTAGAIKNSIKLNRTPRTHFRERIQKEVSCILNIYLPHNFVLVEHSQNPIFNMP